MSEEIVRCLLVGDRKKLLTQLTQALLKDGLIQDGFDTSSDQLRRAAQVVPAVMPLENPVEDAATVVHAISTGAEAGEELPLFVYFRLQDPAQKDSALPPIVDPLECWIATDLRDIKGEKTLAAIKPKTAMKHMRFENPWRLISGGGEEAVTVPAGAEVLEVRTLLVNGQNLASVIDRTGTTALAAAAYIIVE